MQQPGSVGRVGSVTSPSPLLVPSRPHITGTGAAGIKLGIHYIVLVSAYFINLLIWNLFLI